MEFGIGKISKLGNSMSVPIISISLPIFCLTSNISIILLFNIKGKSQVSPAIICNYEVIFIILLISTNSIYIRRKLLAFLIKKIKINC